MLTDFIVPKCLVGIFLNGRIIDPMLFRKKGIGNQEKGCQSDQIHTKIDIPVRIPQPNWPWASLNVHKNQTKVNVDIKIVWDSYNSWSCSHRAHGNMTLS